jgi:hypothetical protein
MRVQHAWRRHRLAYLPIVLAGLFVGCDGKSKEPGATTSTDSNAGTRRKEMEEFMKNQAPPAPSKGAPRDHP